MKKKYSINVDCANCAAKMEEAARKIKGVKSLNINFMMLRMVVEFEEGFDESTVLKEVEKVCKKVDSDFELFK